MADKLVIQTAVDASGVVAGVDQTVTGLQRIGAAQEQVAAEAQKLSGSQAEAAQVAQAYSVSLQTAERALTILGAAAGQAMNDVAALDAAMDEAQAETAQAAASTRAYIEEMKASAAAMSETTAAEEKQSQMSEALAGALQRVGIAESEVAEMATKMGISLEVAGRAMFLIKQSEMATAVAAARMEIEAMTPPTLEAAAAQTALGDASAKAGNTGAMAFGRGSPFFHAMVGASNISRGGTMALRGFFEEVELASFMLPGAVGPLLLLAATIGTIADRMATAKHGATDLKEANELLKKSEEELGKASIDAAEKRMQAIEAGIDAEGNRLAAEEKFNEALEAESGYNQKALDDVEKLIMARTKLAVAELENQRQIALGNARSKEDVDAINEKYKNLIQGTEEQGDADVLTKKVQASAQDIADKTGEQRRVGEGLAPLQDELQAHRDATSQAQQDAAALGIVPDVTGSYKEAQKAAAENLAHWQKQRKKTGYADPGVDAKVDDAAASLAAANKANDYTEGLKAWEQKLGPHIEKLSKQFDDLGSKIEQAKTNNQILQIEQQTAETSSKTKRLADLQSVQQEAAQTAYDLQRAALESQKKDIETQQQNPSLSDGQKAALKAKSDDLDASMAQLELDGKPGLSDAEKIGLRGDVKNDRQRSVYDIDAGDKKTDANDDATQLREVRGRIEASGNKEAIQEMHRIMELVLDKNVQIAQLQMLANATFSMKHDELANAVQKLEQQVSNLTRRGDSHTNSQGASN